MTCSAVRDTFESTGIAIFGIACGWMQSKHLLFKNKNKKQSSL